MKTPLKLLILVAGALLLAVACGSGDATDAGSVDEGSVDEGSADEGSADEGTASESGSGEADTAGTDDEAEDAGETSSSGGTATMTIADGTVYEFALTSCATSDTDPNGFPLDNGYELVGRTADDAFSVQVSRAGFSNDAVVFAGILEGDFDDEGKNALMLYSMDRETASLTAAGTEISGTVMLRAVGPPTRPHGDDTDATLEAQC